MLNTDEEKERIKGRIVAEELLKIMQEKFGGMILRYVFWLGFLIIFALAIKFGIISINIQSFQGL